jgi:hypothetical protein
MKVNVYIHEVSTAVAQNQKPLYTGRIVHYTQQLNGQNIRDMAIVVRDSDHGLNVVSVLNCQESVANVIKK